MLDVWFTLLTISYDLFFQNSCQSPNPITSSGQRIHVDWLLLHAPEQLHLLPHTAPVHVLQICSHPLLPLRLPGLCSLTLRGNKAAQLLHRGVEGVKLACRKRGGRGQGDVKVCSLPEEAEHGGERVMCQLHSCCTVRWKSCS